MDFYVDMSSSVGAKVNFFARFARNGEFVSVHSFSCDAARESIAVPTCSERIDSLLKRFRVSSMSSDVMTCTLFIMKLVIPSDAYELPRTVIAYVGCLALRDARVKYCTLLIVQ